MRRDTVVFNGDRYHRYPESEYKHLRDYYWAHTEGSPTPLHREKWREHNGKIPGNHVIHHKDGDTLNNDIDNLVCMSKSEHQSMHVTERLSDPNELEQQREHLEDIREKATEWHKSEEGIEWHKEHYENVKDKLHERNYEHECIVCGDTYESTRKEKTKFCSKSCENKRQYKRSQEQRTCVCCGEVYETSKYSDSQTCDATCAANLREGNC